MKCSVCDFGSETPVCAGYADQSRRLRLTPDELRDLAAENKHTSSHDLILERAIEVGLLQWEPIEVAS